MEEVRGSIPLSSTTKPQVRRPGVLSFSNPKQVWHLNWHLPELDWRRQLPSTTVPFAVQFFSMGSNASRRPEPDTPKESAVLLTTDQVIEMLQVSRSTIYELIDQGRLRPVKLGRLVRYSRANIEAMIGESWG